MYHCRYMCFRSPQSVVSIGFHTQPPAAYPFNRTILEFLDVLHELWDLISTRRNEGQLGFTGAKAAAT